MITVVGSINLDLIAAMDRLPEPGETVLGNNFATAPGGKGANQALAAARAGAKVRMVGAVGRDSFAGEAVELLKAGGVDLGRVAEIEGATGIAVIFVGGDGENVIAVIPGANATVDAAAIRNLEFAPGEHILLQHEIPLAAVEAVLDSGRAAGSVTLLNTAPFRADAAPLLAKADYAVANETEFDLFADVLSLPGGSREERMRAYAATTGRAIIVTLGGDGVLAATPQEFLKVAAMKITPVDTVGAGDTFCGYLGAGLDSGLPLGEALRRAAAAGSLACLKPGAQPAIPLSAEVDAALT
ncbi:ribokinase [Arvimicrobium flavum]|uniref:ribokinase n=1 Tax=Arvimicrobium flavum TaxID=3393320 RepID=UPI00237ADDA6|nr:ribokinase [Mesorhizobium shangrilense]